MQARKGDTELNDDLSTADTIVFDDAIACIIQTSSDAKWYMARINNHRDLLREVGPLCPDASSLFNRHENDHLVSVFWRAEDIGWYAIR